MRTKMFFGITMGLLFLGVATYEAFVQPSLSRVRSQTQARDDLVAKREKTKLLTLEEQALAEGLSVTNLRNLSATEPSPGPVVFLGIMLDQAGLKRLELAVTESKESEHLRRTKFSLMAQGDYPKIVAFIQALEQSTRLVVVSLIRISEPNASGQLEVQLKVTVFDPLEELSS